ncbi:uncharacterized protein ZC84.1 isoform X4 [Biomphalaria glabrata]|nr:uncharacterized protein ZC84.1 isoform X4 [Biomphalaria glabrata]XP_055901665.1 uncharacterized protein ZC84.1 isoform X4 [Biomphalaria glabrata]XP_055901674.1 uncharacterized protein ZC84.1 isoform X4 [Biomphalaria glabrata]XP_055901681.1 uncharacterized protein ZC84.1 isoform X4 [Biomphalaria glabrata]
MSCLKIVLLHCFIGIALSVNAISLSEKSSNHNNVLYFQSHEETLQLALTMTNGSCQNTSAFFCSDNYTCCKANPQSKVPFVCCPLAEAVCCPDGMHCCPRGTFCDMINRRCYSKGENVHIIQYWNYMSPQQLKTREKAKSVPKTVPCADGSQCPDGSTCCQLASGGYGCCPLVQATCCADHVHCCPNGYKCDLSAGTCVKGLDVVAWSVKQPAEKPKKIQKLTESVVCPGGQAQCPGGATCCKLQSGDYGCCPYVNAVCCSDGLHCCPNGYRCDVDQGECKKGDSSVQWFLKVLAKPVSENVEVGLNSIRCDDTWSCPDGNTCCKLASGEYGCCPLPRATCCDDHIHCCPNGYTCDVSAGTCNKGNDIVAWLSKQPAKVVGDVQCDDTSSCPDGNTCCKLASGQYGCCPLPKATCCDDHVHCCPNGYTCDVSAGTCNKGNDIVAWLSKQPAKVVGDVQCDDTSSCPDGNTCCKLASGQYGCCPLPKATCCDDHVHCCPNGYTCDVSAGTCNRGNDIVAWLTKKPAKVVGDVQCDDTSSCPDGNTCCKLASGQYGCCPLPKATCCDDHVHCCPNGYTCDVSAGTCNRGNDIVAWLTKKPAKVVGDVQCDDTSSCPDGNTCCKLASGQYGCCPLPKATCCDDHVHCCPNGYTCDVSTGTCNRGNDIVAWLTKKPAKVVGDVQCDDTSSCPDGNTCCKLASGQYGCCPLPKATCCDDHVHCCPNGYTCDVSAGTCNKGNDIVAWLSKKPAKVVGDVQCDDTSSCPAGNSCCKLASGQYGCCPLPKATCCDDHVHCCPNGYTCDVSAGTCNKGNDIVAWLTKQPAKVVGDVQCDDTSSCPDGNTCCKLASGQYGCCPLPKATCCDDHVHCCPHGYTCDVSAGTCNKGNDIVAWLTKQPAKVVGDVQCDDTSICPDGNTCCKLASGQYGCCPLPKATCCDDHVHCCPNGYTCDVSAGTCNKGNNIVAWLTKKPAKVVGDVQCDDTSSCPDGNTCCKLASGQYGCCPLPKATCCDDHVHCCPNGYTCDVSAGTCNKGNNIVAWLTKQPAKVVGDVQCDDTSSCPDGNTCCKLASGQYGCCPLPKATCCDDHVHCCPNGYTCDVSAGTCNKGNDIVAWLKKQPAKVVGDVQCDDTSSCPDGNTCCKLASGQYGCCPLPKATCCDDHVHCCPHGYTCDVSAGTCNKGNDVIAWVNKKAANIVH